MLVHLTLQQYLPFTVLKPCNHRITLNATKCVATVLTVYGIETPCKHTDNHCYCQLQQYLPFAVLKTVNIFVNVDTLDRLQQHLLFTVCDEGCEAAEERSDDEVRTSLVPDRREGKTKMIE